MPHVVLPPAMAAPAMPAPVRPAPGIPAPGIPAPAIPAPARPAPGAPFPGAALLPGGQVRLPAADSAACPAAAGLRPAAGLRVFRAAPFPAGRLPAGRLPAGRAEAPPTRVAARTSASLAALARRRRHVVYPKMEPSRTPNTAPAMARSVIRLWLRFLRTRVLCTAGADGGA